MSELLAVARTPLPLTREGIAAALRALGLQPGMTVLVHSSLSALGWVAGGPVAVVQALMDVVTEAGTLLMPAFSSDYSEPSLWQNPPVPRSWWPLIRQHMPAFDPRITPTRQMGRIAETFRTWPGVLRSYHPHVSFAAWGRDARHFTRDHPLAYPLGEGSPLARLYEADGWVLLLGVGFGNNTSFHLAEYRVADPPLCENAGPVLEDGRRVWRVYEDVDIDDGPFPEIGVAFEATGAVRSGRVGAATARFFRQRAAVDFALAWLETRRQARSAG